MALLISLARMTVGSLGFNSCHYTLTVRGMAFNMLVTDRFAESTVSDTITLFRVRCGHASSP